MVSNESITFRLNSTVLRTLRDHAEDNKISINTLVNQVLSSYVDWEMISAKAGFVTVHKDVLIDLFNSVEPETIKKIGLKTADSIKEANLLIYGKSDLEAVLSSLRNTAKRSGFHIRDMDEGGKKVIIIQHDVGRNWSEFSKVRITRLINDAGSPVEIDITDNSILIRLPK